MSTEDLIKAKEIAKEILKKSKCFEIPTSNLNVKCFFEEIRLRYIDIDGTTLFVQKDIVNLFETYHLHFDKTSNVMMSLKEVLIHAYNCSFAFPPIIIDFFNQIFNASKTIIAYIKHPTQGVLVSKDYLISYFKTRGCNFISNYIVVCPAKEVFDFAKKQYCLISEDLSDVLDIPKEEYIEKQKRFKDFTIVYREHALTTPGFLVNNINNLCNMFTTNKNSICSTQTKFEKYESAKDVLSWALHQNCLFPKEIVDFFKNIYPNQSWYFLIEKNDLKLPEDSTPVLAIIKNSFGKYMYVRAAYYRKFELLASDDADIDMIDHDENSGEDYAPEGWYEITEFGDDAYVRIDQLIYSWQPMPALNIDLL